MLVVLASRHTVAALPTLVRLVGGTDAELGAEAAKALGVMGQGAQLPALTAVIVATDNAQLRAACEEAAQAICTRAQDKAAGAERVLGALAQAQQPSARAALLHLLGYMPGPAPLAAVVKAMSDNDTEVHQAAFRTLVSWPDAAALPQLGGGGAPRAGLRRRDCGVARRMPAARGHGRSAYGRAPVRLPQRA